METTKIQKSNSSGTDNSISHALSVLNDVADDSAEEIRGMMKNDYQKLKRVLSDVRPDLKGALSEFKNAGTDSVIHVRDRAMKATKEVAQNVDEYVRNRPWTTVAGAALGSFIIGYLYSRGRRH